MQLGFLCDVQNQQKACCPFLLCLMSSLNTFSSAALCSFRSREFLLCPINLICTMIISLKWWYKTEDCLNFYAGFYPFYCFFTVLYSGGLRTWRGVNTCIFIAMM